MHIKKIYRNEGAPQAKGIAPMNAAAFASKNPEGWVETKDGLILVFKGTWPPEQYPSKEAAMEAGNVLNEALSPEILAVKPSDISTAEYADAFSKAIGELFKKNGWKISRETSTGSYARVGDVSKGGQIASYHIYPSGCYHGSPNMHVFVTPGRDYVGYAGWHKAVNPRIVLSWGDFETAAAKFVSMYGDKILDAAAMPAPAKMPDRPLR